MNENENEMRCKFFHFIAVEYLARMFVDRM